MSQQLIELAEKTNQPMVSRGPHPVFALLSQGGLNPILQLQRTLGNQRVAQLIKAKRLTPEGKILGLQPILTVGAANDQYEHEADHVARQVMSMSHPVAANSMQRDISPEDDKGKMLHTKPLAASITPFMQRQMADNEESEDKQGPVQAKFLTETSKGLLQRQPEADEEEKEPIQKSGRSMSDSFEAGDDVESQVSQSKGRGSPLPAPVRAYMEPRFGTDFSHVHVHTGNEAIAMSRRVGAQAFTHGSDIYYGGESSPANLELTAHELTHVVQQTGATPLQVMRQVDLSLERPTEPARRTCKAFEGNRDASHVPPHPGKPTLVPCIASPVTLQRKVADDPTLSSPRFAGDPILEACFHDKARLMRGAKGSSVKKVQQALVDLGFDLGSTGADGRYGNRTTDAVRQFKKEQQLGFEQIGDVGPGTMARLNDLFPDQAEFVRPLPEAKEEEEISCPSDDDIVAVGQQRQRDSNALVESTTTSGAPALTTAAGSKPVSIDEAVDRFKQKVNVSNAQPGLNISDRGQFHWGTQIAAEVEADLTSIAFEPGGREFEQKGKKVLLLILLKPEGDAVGPGLQELTTIANKAPAAVRQRMLDLLADKLV